VISSQIATVLKQAQLTATLSNKIAESVSITAVFITPTGQYTALGVERMMNRADFIDARSELIQIRARLQPGIYFDQLVKYRDALTCQVIISSSTDRVMKEYVAVPLTDKDVHAESNSTIANKTDALNTTNLVPYEFQLIDKGYAKIRNIPVSNIYLMANVRDALMTIMEQGTQAIGLTGYDKYQGLELYEPVDNVNNYRQIIFPSGTRLKDVPQFLQKHNEHGVYSKGLGSFYKQNHWWIYPLYNTERVKTHPRPLNLIRVPQNKIPDLNSTFYVTPTALTIILTGKGDHTDHADIRKQNEGVGQRLIMGDAIAGDTGYHYNAGRALTTRADSMQEYKLSDRRDGEEWIPINPNPTGNIMVSLSENARNQGEILQVEWRNGDTGYLEPGHPLTYQYFYDDDTVYVRRGVLLGYRNDYIPVTSDVRPILKRTTILTIFLKAQDRYTDKQTS
jgi:hypothetical protein